MSRQLRRRRVPLGLGVVLAGGLAALASCAVGDWPFTASESLPTTTIPAGTILPSDSTTLVVQDLLNISQDSEYQAQEFDYVTSLVVTALVIEVTAFSPAQDFSDLAYASVSLSADIDGDGTAEVTEIAFQDDPVSFASGMVDFVTTGADIHAYLEVAGGYEILVEVKGTGSATAQDLEFGGTVTYTVTVGLDKILGCAP